MAWKHTFGLTNARGLNKVTIKSNVWFVLANHCYLYRRVHVHEVANTCNCRIFGDSASYDNRFYVSLRLGKLTDVARVT